MSGTLLLAPEWLGLSGLWLIDAKGKRKAVIGGTTGGASASSRSCASTCIHAAGGRVSHFREAPSGPLIPESGRLYPKWV